MAKFKASTWRASASRAPELAEFSKGRVECSAGTVKAKPEGNARTARALVLFSHTFQNANPQDLRRRRVDMSMRKYPELWERHQTAMAYIGSNYSIGWAMANRFTPKLQQASLEWFRGEVRRYLDSSHHDNDSITTRTSRIAGDLLPQKVGVISYHVGGDDFQLHCIPASWAEGVVSRRKNVEGKEHEPERVKMLAVTGLIHTTDNRYVLGRRSTKGRVDTTPGTWHVSAAGYVDLYEFDEEGDLVRPMLRELKEETNLELFTSLSMLMGFSDHYQPESGHVEASFLIHTYLTFDEIIARGADAKDRAERDEYRAFTADEVLDLLKTDKWNPAGAATVMMALGY